MTNAALIKAARLAAHQHRCKLSRIIDQWLLTHTSTYLDDVIYGKGLPSVDQVTADAVRLDAEYREKYEADDPGADPLKETDQAAWFAKWYGDRIVRLPDYTVGARLAAMEQWCRATIGPYIKEWTNQPSHFRFRQEKNRVLFALVMRDFYNGNPLDPERPKNSS